MLIFPSARCKKRQANGFTLIELSIVIIGLIVGGVLTGRDLIKAAEVRSVIKDIETYKTAVNTFRLKYNCLAGDCPNATTYFGAQATPSSACAALDSTTPSTGSLTCDGDGDGQVLVTYERFRFWQHLAIAGLIKGQYTGVNGSSSSNAHVLGQNSPVSAISGATFGFGYFNNPSGGGNFYTGNLQNAFVFGIQGTDWPLYGVFTPTEAFAFDQKIDDGKPGTGFVTMQSRDSAGTALNWGATGCTTSTTDTDYNGAYRTTVTTPACSFYIRSGL